MRKIGWPLPENAAAFSEVEEDKCEADHREWKSAEFPLLQNQDEAIALLSGVIRQEGGHVVNRIKHDPERAGNPPWTQSASVSAKIERTEN